MHQSDWFAVVLAVLVLGSGLVFSTYKKQIIRRSGYAIIVSGLAGLMFWFGYYRNVGAEAQVPPSGNCNNFIGGNNSGTINTNCPTVFQGPPPTLHALGSQPVQKTSDNKFNFTWFFEVVSTTPAKTLTCVAKADGNVLGVGLSSSLGTMFSSGKDGNGNFYAILSNASGKYSVDVKASAETPIPSVRCQVE